MKNKITSIYVIRHGESMHNAGKSNTLDSGLTKLGKKQARELSTKFKNIHFDAIFSSDFARAKETAETIAAEKKLAVSTSKIIRERSYHSYKEYWGKDEEEFLNKMKRALSDLNDEQKMKFKLNDNMESPEESVYRLFNYLRELAIAWQGKTLLVICHGNVMRSVLTHLGYAKFDELPAGSIKNTGYFRLETDGIDFFLKDTFGISIHKGAIRNF
jgi:broad specificity phosphatase PhoE